MFMVLWIMGCILPRLLHWLLIQMLIGRVARPLDILFQVIVFSLATIYCLGHPRGSILCLDLVLRLSTVMLLMRWLRLPGYEIFFASFILFYIRLPFFIVIMPVQYIYLPISCNINARSTSRLTFTLFGIRCCCWIGSRFACSLTLSVCIYFH